MPTVPEAPVTQLTAYGAAVVVFLGLDALWLGVVARGFYARRLGALLRPRPDLRIALVFYLFYVAGIVLFAVQPGLAAESWAVAAAHGAALGLLAYGTYDLTNQATLRDWPVAVTLVDMAWGGALTATAAIAGFLAARHLG